LDNPHITLTFAVAILSADDIFDVGAANCVTVAPFAAAANDDEDERNDDSHCGFSKIALLFIRFSAAIGDWFTNSFAAVDHATSESAFDPAEDGLLTAKMKGILTIKIGSRGMKCVSKIIPRVK
jgi:hypothetical protein